MTRVRRTFIDGPFGQVHCRVADAADNQHAALVCLHMSPKSGRLFTQVMPHLAKHRTVLAPDYPGHGESDKPPAEPHVTVADFAQSCWAAIDALTDSPVHFVGYHTGSMVAVEAAHQRPQDVLSIINISAPILNDAELTEAKALYQPLPLDEAGSRFDIMWERVMFHRGPGMTLQMAADSFAENLRAGDDYEWGHRAAFDYGKTYVQRLSTLTKPLLVMNPNDDCHAWSKRIDEVQPAAQRIDYMDWGHGFPSAYPEAAAKEILEFICQYDSSSR